VVGYGFAVGLPQVIMMCIVRVTELSQLPRSVYRYPFARMYPGIPPALEELSWMKPKSEKIPKGAKQGAKQGTKSKKGKRAPVDKAEPWEDASDNEPAAAPVKTKSGRNSKKPKLLAE
jgi:hypothetical protein